MVKEKNQEPASMSQRERMRGRYLDELGAEI
jgi:hypothetical protein